MLKRAARPDDPDFEATWEWLVNEYTRRIHTTCRQMYVPSHQIADIAQEVLVGVWRALPRFERQRSGSFRAMVRVITRRKILDFRRATRGQMPSGGSANVGVLNGIADDPDPSTISGPLALQRRVPEELEPILRRIEESVKPRTWEAFSRAYMDGESPKDVAESMGMSDYNVRNIGTRLRKQIRDEAAQIGFHIPDDPVDDESDDDQLDNIETSR